mmetsp:Transcript_12726/g.32082  ORF Transcript_12726/g.32082 Transcript_12726/m.32082 type:complete len:89 (+) Transcript_12726:2349-2615(+)
MSQVVMECAIGGCEYSLLHGSPFGCPRQNEDASLVTPGDPYAVIDVSRPQPSPWTEDPKRKPSVDVVLKDKPARIELHVDPPCVGLVG